MPEAFAAIDLNGDGFLQQCEEASLLFNTGSDKEYAIKFAGAYTLEAVVQSCYDLYPAY
jgi:hypothetical protein